MKTQILLVEDDNSISDMVANYLRKEGFDVVCTYDGEQGIQAVMSQQYDLVLLDLMLPKLDGLEFLKLVRVYNTTPVLIISAKDDDVDKVVGLEFGADDYIVKPFSLIELTARVKAMIRRTTKYSPTVVEKKSVSRVLKVGELTINVDDFTVTKNGQDIMLTSKEFQILYLLASNPNKVFTKEHIYRAVWNEEYYSDENSINVQISRLRDKIEDRSSKPQYIKTLWGIGYKLGEF
ncbi:response regulator transcription factor [Virgibacillus sp. Bac332]|uniref:response regulator transcription factor n=1 Tax=Virgibacillus sp. Bac332 TaxID=2419842 RepID=UPI000EF47678|nr:response regulator transcription factor [Virgibacillus sp. Bac332]